MISFRLGFKRSEGKRILRRFVFRAKNVKRGGIICWDDQCFKDLVISKFATGKSPSRKCIFRGLVPIFASRWSYHDYHQARNSSSTSQPSLAASGVTD